jgi:hypothetical protein
MPRGHRTSNDEMMRVPRDLADYVRSEAPKRGLTYMAFMRELVLVHLAFETDEQEAKKPKAKKVGKAKAPAAALVPEPLPPQT